MKAIDERITIERAVRAAGLLAARRLWLDTFSALTTAAHIYRGAGFRLVGEKRTEKWGPEINFQQYELKLD